MCALYRPSRNARGEFAERLAHQATTWVVAGALTINTAGAALHPTQAQADPTARGADVRLLTPGTATYLSPEAIRDAAPAAAAGTAADVQASNRATLGESARVEIVDPD
jgi:hypothetical protein